MHPLLSARQEQCLRLTAFRTDKEIAAHLGISEATVKKHVHEACQRLGVNRRKAALALLDPVAPGDAEMASSKTPEASSKQPEVVLGAPNLDTPSTSTAAVKDDGRLGYRVPPNSPVLRVLLILVLTIVLAALVVTLVVMLGDMHEAVGKIDAADGVG